MENEDPLVPDVSYGPSSTATVHITVLDVNEGPVFYPDPMMVTKRENISVGSVLLTVNATDPDSLQHQTIRWVSDSLTGDGRQAGVALLCWLSGANYHLIKVVNSLCAWERHVIMKSWWLMAPGDWAQGATAPAPDSQRQTSLGGKWLQSCVPK